MDVRRRLAHPRYPNTDATVRGCAHHLHSAQWPAALPPPCTHGRVTMPHVDLPARISRCAHATAHRTMRACAPNCGFTARGTARCAARSTGDCPEREGSTARSGRGGAGREPPARPRHLVFGHRDQPQPGPCRRRSGRTARMGCGGRRGHRRRRRGRAARRCAAPAVARGGRGGWRPANAPGSPISTHR